MNTSGTVAVLQSTPPFAANQTDVVARPGGSAQPFGRAKHAVVLRGCGHHIESASAGGRGSHQSGAGPRPLIPPSHRKPSLAPPPPPLLRQALRCLRTGTRLTVVFLTFSVACAKGGVYHPSPSAQCPSQRPPGGVGPLTPPSAPPAALHVLPNYEYPHPLNVSQSGRGGVPRVMT